jgi:hypothetical protein
MSFVRDLNDQLRKEIFELRNRQVGCCVAESLQTLFSSPAELIYYNNMWMMASWAIWKIGSAYLIFDRVYYRHDMVGDNQKLWDHMSHVIEGGLVCFTEKQVTAALTESRPVVREAWLAYLSALAVAQIQDSIGKIQLGSTDGEESGSVPGYGSASVEDEAMSFASCQEY